MNKLLITGRITKDIELKEYGDLKVVNNTIAVYDGKDKNNQEITYFFDFKAFNYVANKLSSQAQKGSKIAIEGVLKQDKWEKDGNTIYKTVIYAEDIVICDAKKVDQPKEEVKESEDNLPW